MSADEAWTPSPPLKLRAEDSEDLAVISSCLQDALVPLGDAAYLADEKQFVLVANRFRWETKGKQRQRRSERVLCALCFETVTGVTRRGIGQSKQAGFLNLLMVHIVPPEADSAGPVVMLTFSGGAAIRLETAGLLCHLEDLGESWPTNWQPEHPQN